MFEIKARISAVKNLSAKTLLCAVLLCSSNIEANADVSNPEILQVTTTQAQKSYSYRDAFLNEHKKTYNLKEHRLNYKDYFTDKYSNSIDNSNTSTAEINTNFVYLYKNANGGAIYNSGSGYIGKVIGDFVYSGSGNNGGAIYNNAEINEITGNFYSNDAYQGGAIYNSGDINLISGIFNENYTYSTGGAIKNNGYIVTINAHFNRNSSNYEGGAIINNGGIETINGDFVGNYLVTYDSGLGGAISNTDYIGSINGDFYHNTIEGYEAQACSLSPEEDGNTQGVPLLNSNYSESRQDIAYYDSSTLVGGAIFNEYEIENIKGDFVNNSIYSDTGYHAGAGGAIYNASYIDNIEGNFIDNNIENTVIGEGGAIFNAGGIGTVSGDFVNNSVTAKGLNSYGPVGYQASTAPNMAVKYGGVALGGAIYSTKQIMQQPQALLISSSPSDEYSSTIYYMKLIVKDANGKNIKTLYQYTNDYGDIIDPSGIQEALEDGTIKEFLVESSTIVSEEEYKNILDDMGMTEEEYLTNLPITDLGPDSYKVLNDRHSTLNEIKNLTPSITLKNSNIINNHADSDVNEAKGGAIYSNGTTIKLLADNGTTSVIAGNYTNNDNEIDDNAIYMNGGKLLFETINGSAIQIEDNINGTAYDTYIIGDSNSKLVLNNDIKNSNIELYGTNLHLANRDNVLNGNNLSLNSGTISMVNNEVGISELNKLTVYGNTKFIADVDLKNQKMDRFTATEYGNHTGNLNVVGMNLISDAKTDKTEIYFAEKGLKDNVTGELTLPNDAYQTTLFTPIYKYNVSYDNREDAGYFIFARSSNNGGSGSFNPAILGAPTSANVGAMGTMNNTFNYAFQNSDNFMNIPYLERIAMKKQNHYALAITGDATDMGKFSPLYQPNDEGASIWVKPYATFENVPLRNGPKVDNISYGTLIGFDTPMERATNGWDRVWTGYLGYNGASQSYGGTDSVQNGGLVGGTLTLYKDNFFNATTLSVGANVANNENMYGSEDFTMLLGGVGNKTGYNIEFKDGRIILQPSMLISYTFVNTFDYTNAAGVNIENKPLHAIQLAPGMKLIGNSKNGWQPYFGASMIWNLMGKNDTTANGVKLPEMCIKPYVQYGFGIQKRFESNFMAFGQAMVQHGGRNGVSLTAGMRWAVGHETENEKVENKKPKNKFVAFISKLKKQKNGDLHVLKDLTPEQKAELIEKRGFNTLKNAMNE